MQNIRWMVVGMLLGMGCTPSSRAVVDQDAIRQSEQEKQYLADSARLYWEGMRWGDAEKVAAFIESEEDRALFRARLEDAREVSRVVEADVLRTKLIPAAEALSLGSALPANAVFLGEAWVRTEGYTLPAQILRTEEVKQSWYRTTAGWWIAWDPDAESAEAPQ